jgi:hypothetical protein
VASTDIVFNKVVVLGDHSSIWTFGNSAGTTGIMVKWTSAGVDSLTLSLASMADITAASLFVDQSTIFIGGQTSASKMYVGALRLSDTSLVMDKYFDVASSSVLDIAVNDMGQVGIASSETTSGGIINFDADFNDKCSALTITSFAGSLTASTTSVSSEVTGQTLYSIFPTIVSGSITSSTSTTTVTPQTCGEVCVPVILTGSTLTVGGSLSASVATFAFSTLVTSFTYSATLMDESTPGSWWISVSSGGTISGTSTSGQTTYLKVRATYTDTLTYTSSAIYKITVTNTSPIVSVNIPDQSASVGTAFSFGFTNSVFSDSDSGDSLTFSSELSSGAVLSSWLTFDADNKLFAGTPTSAATYNIKVIATDLGGSSANDVFQIIVSNNDPVAASGTTTNVDISES